MCDSKRYSFSFFYYEVKEYCNLFFRPDIECTLKGTVSSFNAPVLKNKFYYISDRTNLYWAGIVVNRTHHSINEGSLEMTFTVNSPFKKLVTCKLTQLALQFPNNIN